MAYWLALLVVTAFASLALGLTVRAWRTRRTTPRSLSLALSGAACGAIVVAAIDLTLPLPTILCEEEIKDPEGPLEEALARALGSWSWHLWPCGRVVVTPSADDLAASLDHARLSALAIDAGVVVDVVLTSGMSLQTRELMLLNTAMGRSMPIGTAIPTTYTNRVRPVFAGAADVPLSCRLGDEPFSPALSLDQLLGTRPGSQSHGFHRLQCRSLDDPNEALTTAYVHVTSVGIEIASSDTELKDSQERVFPELPDVSSFGLDFTTFKAEAEPSEGPAMLVLDRPQRPESCKRALELLDRGGTVVIAMPGAEFMAGCAGRLPIDRKDLVFDRRPRLTFLFDDFADDLPLQPSCTFFSSDCRVGSTQPTQLDDSTTIQETSARSACMAAKTKWTQPVHCEHGPTPLADHNDAFAPVRMLTRAHADQPTDMTRIGRSFPGVALTEIHNARESHRPRTAWENELIVVFSYGHEAAPHSGGIPEFLDRSGAKVYVQRVQDPYAVGLRELYPAPTTATAPASALQLVHNIDTRLGAANNAVCEGSRCVPPIDLKDAWPLQTTAEPFPASPRPWGRFHFPALAPDENAAPVQFAWLTLDPARSPAPVELARTTTENGLKNRSLAIGTMVGRGHLLVLAYSPFERYHGDLGWKDAPVTHERVLGGMRWIAELYAATESLLAGAAGQVVEVASRPDGTIWVTMSAGPADDALDTRSFSRPGTTITASLVDFDFERGLFTYAISADALANNPCTVLKVGTGAAQDAIHACPLPPEQGTRATMDSASGLELLAYSTGGTVMRADRKPDRVGNRDTLHTRSLGLGALSLILLAWWARRASRRLAGIAAYRRLRTLLQTAQRRYDPPDAVVAAAGDWDGRCSTWPRMGAFGGYRPLEPGDRTSAIVLRDLILIQEGGTQVMPRVMQRIEEASPVVTVLVNLGASMRVPERRSSSKALFAGRVAHHVAAAAWKIRGEVSIHAVGVQGDAEIIAPGCLSPGHEELEASLRARLRQHPERDSRPWPATPPDCSAVVYVSDFQLEDERALQAWLAELEGLGLRVAGVMIYSPTELTMIEGGRLAGSGVWADRTDWDPDDVFAALDRRRAALAGIFDATTTGGLVVLSTDFDQEDIEVALGSGRLLQILR